MSRLPKSNQERAHALATSTVHTSNWRIAQFESGKWSDLVIECNGRKWHVHRIIVCGQSPFLEKACEGNFLEATSGIINLPDDDPNHVERMLRYMYVHDYTDIQHASEHQDSSVVINVCMYVIADKYRVLLLKDRAISKFQEGLEGAQNLDTLIRDVVAAVNLIYTTIPNSDRSLRDPLATIFKKYKKALYDDAEFMAMLKSGFADGDFTLDVINAWTNLDGEDSADGKDVMCSDCFEDSKHHREIMPTIFCVQCAGKLHGH